MATPCESWARVTALACVCRSCCAGGPIAGRCVDGTPLFADTLKIREKEAFLEIFARSDQFTGRADGPRFQVSAVYGVIDCGTGWYDLDLTIIGERLTPSTYYVTQSTRVRCGPGRARRAGSRGPAP